MRTLETSLTSTQMRGITNESFFFFYREKEHDLNTNFRKIIISRFHVSTELLDNLG